MGQWSKATSDQRWEKLLCKTENYVPQVVPELSSNSSTSSSSTSPPRSNEEAAGNCSEGLPEWLEDFSENLEIVEMPAAANTSHDSDPERPVKVTSRKHSINTHLPKDQNCKVCKRTKIAGASCRRRTGDSVPRTEKFGDLITADHKVLNECESRKNHR